MVRFERLVCPVNYLFSMGSRGSSPTAGTTFAFEDSCSSDELHLDEDRLKWGQCSKSAVVSVTLHSKSSQTLNVFLCGVLLEMQREPTSPVSAAGSDGRRNTCLEFTRWSLKS